MARNKIRGTEAHTRYYLKDGTLVPGVTTITKRMSKDSLVSWSNKLGLEGISYDSVMEATSKIGSATHEMIRQSFVPDGCEDVFFDETLYSPLQVSYAKECYAKFRRWKNDHDFKCILCEEQLVSEDYKYGGTLDLYGELNGNKCLIDVKTGASIWPEQHMQLAALYSLLISNGYPIEKVYILRLGRDAMEGYEFVEFNPENTMIWFARFLLYLEDYNLERTINKPLFDREKEKRK